VSASSNPRLSVVGSEPRLETISWKKKYQPELNKLLSGKQDAELAQFLSFSLPEKIGKKRTTPALGQHLRALENLAVGKLETEHPLRMLVSHALAIQDEKKPRKRLRSEFRSELKNWIQSEIATELNPQSLVETVLEVGLFLLSGHNIDETLRLDLYDRLTQYRQLLDAAEVPDEDEAINPLPRLQICAELPLLLGLALRHQTGSSQLVTKGRSAFAAELDALTDTDGTPHGSLINDLPFWMAAFNRCQFLCEASDEKWLKKSAVSRWNDLVQRSASLTLMDGSLALSNGAAHFWSQVFPNSISPELLRRKKQPTWIKQTLNLTDTALARGLSEKRSRNSDDLEAATQSDWAKVASLRNNWFPGFDGISLKYDSNVPHLVMSALSQPLLSGRWETTLTIAGKPHALDSEWSSLCWYNDEAGDYLELRNESVGVTIDRQIFLSRTDHVALFCDAVSMENDQALDLQWTLPLVQDWNATPCDETRLLRLDRNKHRVRVLPLALPCDRIDRPDGVLRSADEGIELQLSGRKRLCMPLWLDWSPARRKSVSDWNRLTVTEDRQVLAFDKTFASRCRIGNSQWLFLRNLEFNGIPRAVVGLHTDAETIIAEFPKTGIAEKLVEVHYAEDDED